MYVFNNTVLFDFLGGEAATVEDLASSPLNDDGGAVAYDASNGEQNSRQSAAATAPRTATCCGCFSPPGMSAVPDEEGGGTQQNTQTGRRSLAGIYAALPVLWSTWIFLIILGLAVGVAGYVCYTSTKEIRGTTWREKNCFVNGYADFH